jgi:bifunctional non-homologous end joining protein LigD
MYFARGLLKNASLFIGPLALVPIFRFWNQNRWGSALASVYSVRPTPLATVSAPVTWDEIEDGVEIDDFHMRNMVKRIDEVGDLWAPLAAKRGRFDLRPLIGAVS